MYKRSLVLLLALAGISWSAPPQVIKVGIIEPLLMVQAEEVEAIKAALLDTGLNFEFVVLPQERSYQLLTRGERIFRGGDPERGIAACIACHGPQGQGKKG